MARKKWDKETIIKRILTMSKSADDLTCKTAKENDSALVGAAIKYFGSWGKAIEAAGLDYKKVKGQSRRSRQEKIRKWTREKVLEEIRKLAETEEDLSHTYMKEKYPTLVAAANNYIGSWRKALMAIGLDYADIKKKGMAIRAKNNRQWRCELLLERLSTLPQRDEKLLREKQPRFYEMLIKHFGDWTEVMKAYNKRLQQER